MIKLIQRTNRFLLWGIAIIISSCAISGCLESSFQLANESRLPTWMALPPGLTRADVSVTLNYYGTIGDDAKFILRDKNGRILKSVNGKCKGLYPLHLRNPMQGFPPWLSSLRSHHCKRHN
jgi:hypothetical protein